VPVTAGEVQAYRKAGAARWFRGDADAAAGLVDPFEPIAGHAPLLRIRKRVDGACGFLSAEGLCRIHEVLGADRKPLCCRLFPFRFHPADDDVVATVSFACPTVIANEGATLSSQQPELQALLVAWRREFPEPAATIELVRGHTLTRAMLAELRSLLGRMLDRPGPNGRLDLRANLRRIAMLLEDLSRRRVLALAPDDWVEYLRLKGGHALKSEKLPARGPSLLARLLFRGFLLAALSVQIGLEPVLGRRRLALHYTRFRLLAHLHGLGPGVAGFNLGRALAMPLCLDDPAVHAIAYRYLRAGFDTLGTGRRTVLDEIAMTVAQLNAACVLGGRHAVAHGKRVVDAESFTQGLLESADLSHADAGHFTTVLTTLSGGIEALYLFPPLAEE
jgi:Fe-S-cluster containining protein